MDGTVLIADDDLTIRTVLVQAFSRAGCKVHATSSLATLGRWVKEGRGDLIISDIIMPDGNGLKMLPKIAETRPHLPVIVISARNTVITAIQAVEADAFDYLPKPFDLPELMKRAARALEMVPRVKKLKPEEMESDQSEDLPLVGQTESMQKLYRSVARIMNTDLSIMLFGENGTGKSLVAQTIHDLSTRCGLPFISLTTEDLSHVDMPFQILEKARGGTILIDDLTGIHRLLQAQIVRMIDAATESGTRFIATSQVNLNSKISDDRIREDLFFRLSGMQISIPALRDRPTDIPLLVEHFLVKAERQGRSKHYFSEEAIALLCLYSWPGNVRQLENVVNQLVLFSRSKEIARTEVEDAIGFKFESDTVLDFDATERLSVLVARHVQRYFAFHGKSLPATGIYSKVLCEVETPLIEIAMNVSGGNQTVCAKLLGINRNTLRKKIADLDIQTTRRLKF